MDIIVLQFQTPQDFTSFRKSIKGNHVGFNIHDLTITCDCSLEEVAFALKIYGARVIPAHTKSPV